MLGRSRQSATRPSSDDATIGWRATASTNAALNASTFAASIAKPAAPLVPAEADQVVSAGRDGLDGAVAGRRAHRATTHPVGLLQHDDDPAGLLGEPHGDEAEHAGRVRRPDDEGGRQLTGVDAERRAGIVQGGAGEVTALAVEGLQLRGEGLGLGGVVGGEEALGDGRLGDPAGGVEARAEPEGDVLGLDPGPGQAGAADQRREAGDRAVVQRAQAVAHDRAVLAFSGITSETVPSAASCNRAGSEPGAGARIEAPLDERLRHLQRDAGPGKLLERVRAIRSGAG